MKSKRTAVSSAMVGVIAAAMLTACSGAPGESEFIATCMK